ncbi:NAD(P)/FAD-dependent oxidoreductase [Pseudomonas parasichuanensis]|uniref:NAD(P)/FAD-dependent oxidoreductase n=1 Tax=Pseudomonas parasichuanensis TaxID=2892329 RepID=UPI001F3D3B7D|nr:FAD-dependent oxidoreductase [Pseudomonas parasichuanensis]
MGAGSGESFDAVIIGGGFYGCAIAIYLARQRGFKRVLLVEREPSLLQRASYHNQARVHNGYHYPRSFTTAYRSRINLPRFVQDWPEAVRQDFTKLYAIARRNSKVTAAQFQRFCKDIGGSILPAAPEHKQLFEPRLIEDVFLVQEYAFDSTKLASWAKRELAEGGVQVRCNSRVSEINRQPKQRLQVVMQNPGRAPEAIDCRYVFNCTYSGLNQFAGDFPGVRSELKQEITEMALMRMPEPLDGIGVTVMDGPFFSMMPFPARGLHTLSHVRYTPHLHWNDQAGVDPYSRLDEYARDSRVDRMVRDVARYIPAIQGAAHIDSLYEVKTVLQKNEGDDGRPILFERHQGLPGCYSVLGSKIDNIYDVLEQLDGEALVPASLQQSQGIEY